MIPLAASAVAVILAAGCGSSSSSSSTAPSTISSRAFDGPISGGTVCIDENNNGVCDTGEPSTTTDAFGNFSLPKPTGDFQLVLVKGVDTGTQKPFLGTFRAPSGSNLNPLNSAVQSLVQNGSSASEAEATIKKALNIISTEPLASFDPFDKIKNGTAAEKTSAKNILAAQVQLQTIVQAVSTAVAKAGSVKIKDTMHAAFNNVANELQYAATTGSNITAQDITNATEATAGTLKTSEARVAARSIAYSTALGAIASASTARTNVQDATSGDVATTFNSGIIVVNSSLKNTLETRAIKAKGAVNVLSQDQLKAIEAAQKASEDADREARKLAEAQAKADAAAAVEAQKVAEAGKKVTAEQIRASQQAQVDAAKAAEELSKQQQAAAKAALEAAQREAKISAAEAAQREAIAKQQALQAEAQTKLDAAVAAQKAAELKAAKDAKDAAEAQKAIAAATETHKVAVAEATKAVEDAKVEAAKAAEEAKKVAEAQAKADAEAAVQEAKAAEAFQTKEAAVALDCQQRNGRYIVSGTPLVLGTCDFTIPTGASN